MASEAEATARRPLTRERVFRGAVDLADREGIEALTMRNLAAELGVEAMSLYYHVANKEAVFDGIVEAIMEEIAAATGGFAVPEEVTDWRATLRMRILDARSVMLRHRWAPGVFESRTRMGPSIVMYFEGLLGILVEGGMSYDLAHHGMHALGSRALGFSQELFTPATPEEGQESQEMFEHMKEQLPYLAGMTQAIAHEGPDGTLGWCDDQTEFEFALDVLLEGLERRRMAEPGA